MRVPQSHSAFRLFGAIGFAAGCALAAGLAAHAGLSLWIVAALAVSGGIAFFALAMATKIVTGEESLTYYHHQTAVLLASAFVLWRLHAPMLPYLDITVLGLGVFLAFGRIGCLKAGCCHGRPSHRGVEYGNEFTGSGFPRNLVEVRLFPVQPIESLWVLGVVCLGVLQVTMGFAPGSAFSSYLVLYGLGRFVLEFWRGGADRPYFWNFSEAQWTSFAVVCGVACAEALGALPREGSHEAVLAILVVLIIGLEFHPRWCWLHRLFHPRHIDEFAQAIELVRNLSAQERDRQSPATIHVAATRMGIRISCGPIAAGETTPLHYTVSQTGKAMTVGTAKLLANLVAHLTRCPAPVRVLEGRSGAFHLLMRDGFSVSP